MDRLPPAAVSFGSLGRGWRETTELAKTSSSRVNVDDRS
jgi:hypothetical protein